MSIRTSDPEYLDSPNSQRGCMECGTSLRGREAAAVICSTLVDVLPPAEWQHVGCSFSNMALVCGDCAPGLLEMKPEALARRLRHSMTGVYHHEIYTQQDGLRPLMPVSPRMYPTGPLSFFEGRAASLRESSCRDAGGLLKYCVRMERASGLRAVGCFSSDYDISAVYHFGLCLAQEGFTDGGPPFWFLNPRMIGPTRIAYLITNRTAYVGAVAFDVLGYNTMTWAWLHPSVRRQGILSRLWPHFEVAHHDFKVQTPLSVGMQQFLASRPGHELTELTGPARRRAL
jgi:hypothetical protein